MDWCFDAAFDVDNALASDPPLREEPCADLDQWERQFHAQVPLLAKAVVVADRMLRPVSKKQLARERAERLHGLSKAVNRNLFEKAPEKYTVLSLIKNIHDEGPLSVIRTAVKSKTQVEVRVLGPRGMDRVLIGTPTAFDNYCNVVLADVEDTYRSSRSNVMTREAQLRNSQTCGIGWQVGGQWPNPVLARGPVYRRRLPLVMIKGSDVICVRQLRSNSL